MYFGIYNVLVALFATIARYGSCQSADACVNTTDSLTPYLNRRYELAESDEDNFEDLMEYLGVNWVMRKAIVLAKPVMELKFNDNTTEYTISSESFFRNIYTTFQLGREFEEKTPDGRYVLSKFTAEGNKLMQTQRDEWNRITTITREFYCDRAIVTASVDNKFSCCRIYNAL
jgi:hypothetical protein